MGAFVSERGEDQTQFLKRVGQSFHQHTKITGHETCGVVARNQDNQWAVLAFSDGVQMGCGMRYSQVPDGFESTGETIHTHPVASTVVLNARDRAWNKRYNGTPEKHVVAVNPDFSHADLNGGPGWLVTRGALHHHDGNGWRGRRVGRILDTPAYADAAHCPD